MARRTAGYTARANSPRAMRNGTGRDRRPTRTANGRVRSRSFASTSDAVSAPVRAANVPMIARSSAPPRPRTGTLSAMRSPYARAIPAAHATSRTSGSRAARRPRRTRATTAAVTSPTASAGTSPYGAERSTVARDTAPNANVRTSPLISFRLASTRPRTARPPTDRRTAKPAGAIWSMTRSQTAHAR
ncbi:MAG: hypothetical protein A3K65_07015 [Euryarchaeota archaeon RBG_16_68_12]|nr:MAG: hypothetical protein A3K65_07015 [Euryarchaeota archaeon RBG_16_68_12]